MNTKCDVSMIVPIYNVQDYLPDCLKSIENQTHSEFELILVDDGSTDNSGKIADDYAHNHNNTVVIHQSNQGLSGARNNGVKASQGKYITFVDSDDIISIHYVEYLFDQIEKNNADISIGNAMIVFRSVGAQNTISLNNYTVFGPEEALIHMMYEKKYLCTAWGKMYKRELVERNPYPLGALFEDLAVSYRIFGEAKTISYGSSYIYFWRHRKNSISKQSVTERHINSLLYAQEQIKYMEQNYSNAIPAAQYKYIAKIVSLIPYTFHGDHESRKYFGYLKEKLGQYYDSVSKDKNARRDVIVRASAIKWGYLPSRCIYKLFEIIKPIRSTYLLRKRGIS